MFCPNCGKTVDKKLKYCNGCGERLARENDENRDSPAKILDDILDTLFWFAMGGLGILIGLVAVLLGKGVDAWYVTLIVVVYLATIFSTCFLLARQVPRLIDARLEASNKPSETLSHPQLTPKTTAQLDEYRDPVMSVTDHTTRTLDKVPVKET